MSVSFYSIWRCDTSALPYSTGAQDRGTAGLRRCGGARPRAEFVKEVGGDCYVFKEE
jgi:hypothetical protein